MEPFLEILGGFRRVSGTACEGVGRRFDRSGAQAAVRPPVNGILAARFRGGDAGGRGVVMFYRVRKLSFRGDG